MRIAICDDDILFLKRIEQLIHDWGNKPASFNLQTFTDGDSLISMHRREPFDVILLDVIMPVLNGIGTAKEIRASDKSVKIIFLTSSSEFAVESYTVKADNYLLKPIQSETLYDTLNEIRTELLRKSHRITIKDLHAVYRIEVHNIEYIESQNKHIQFFLTDGRKLESTAPLYSYENDLLFEDGFFKCHRSYIVNIYHISSFTSKDIKMKSGTLIPVSRNVKKEFEEAYFSLLFNEAGENK